MNAPNLLALGYLAHRRASPALTFVNKPPAMWQMADHIISTPWAVEELVAEARTRSMPRPAVALLFGERIAHGFTFPDGSGFVPDAERHRMLVFGPGADPSTVRWRA